MQAATQHPGLVPHPAHASIHHGMMEEREVGQDRGEERVHHDSSYYSGVEGEGPESPQYLQGHGYPDPYQYGETSASASNSGEHFISTFFTPKLDL